MFVERSRSTATACGRPKVNKRLQVDTLHKTLGIGEAPPDAVGEGQSRTHDNPGCHQESSVMEVDLTRDL